MFQGIHVFKLKTNTDCLGLQVWIVKTDGFAVMNELELFWGMQWILCFEKCLGQQQKKKILIHVTGTWNPEKDAWLEFITIWLCEFCNMWHLFKEPTWETNPIYKTNLIFLVIFTVGYNIKDFYQTSDGDMSRAYIILTVWYTPLSLVQSVAIAPIAPSWTCH